MDESLGSQRLATYLRKHDLSPAAFAKLAKANRSQIYRLVAADRGPSVGLAARIEHATGGKVRAQDWTKPPRRTKQRGQVAVRESAAPDAEQGASQN